MASITPASASAQLPAAAPETADAPATGAALPRYRVRFATLCNSRRPSANLATSSGAMESPVVRASVSRRKTGPSFSVTVLSFTLATKPGAFTSRSTGSIFQSPPGSSTRVRWMTCQG